MKIFKLKSKDRSFAVSANSREEACIKLRDALISENARNDASGIDYNYLTEEERKAIEDYKEAIAKTNDPKLLNIFAHILKEETEHIGELSGAEGVDKYGAISVPDITEDSDTVGESLEQRNPSLRDDADIEKYQEWVDYDMERYHRISEETMRKIKEAGFSVVKDQYGEYEVIAYDPERRDSAIKDEEAYIIFKENGVWKGTPESNYSDRIRNAGKVSKFDKFETAEDVVDYLKKYGGKYNYKIVKDCDTIDNVYMDYETGKVLSDEKFCPSMERGIKVSSPKEFQEVMYNPSDMVTVETSVKDSQYGLGSGGTSFWSKRTSKDAECGRIADILLAAKDHLMHFSSRLSNDEKWENFKLRVYSSGEKFFNNNKNFQIAKKFIEGDRSVNPWKFKDSDTTKESKTELRDSDKLKKLAYEFGQMANSLNMASAASSRGILSRDNEEKMAKFYQKGLEVYNQLQQEVKNMKITKREDPFKNEILKLLEDAVRVMYWKDDKKCKVLADKIDNLLKEYSMKLQGWR